MQIYIPCRVRLIFRSTIFRLIFFWFLGLLLGTLFAAGLDPVSLPLMRRLFSASVSIVIHLILAVLPFLICTYGFVIRRQEIVLSMLFCKGFSYALLAVSVYRIYGSASWLLQPMLQLSDLLLMPMLFWFCLRNGRTLMRDHFICLSAAIGAVLIHCCVVLPFVAELIK